MPWYKEVSRQEWKTFLTTFAAWTLDAFDFTIITFVFTDIRRSFEVNAGAGRRAGDRDAVFPDDRRHRRRHAGRSLRPQGPDSLCDRLVHRLRVPERSLDQLRDAVHVPRALRNRHGRHVGGGHAARARAMAGETSRHRVGHPAGRLLDRVPAVVARLSARLSDHQRSPGLGVAIDAVGGRHSGDRDLLPDDARQREPAVARAAAAAGRQARAPVDRAHVRSRSAVGHDPHVAADGRVRVDVSVDDDLVSALLSNLG